MIDYVREEVFKYCPFVEEQIVIKHIIQQLIRFIIFSYLKSDRIPKYVLRRI